MNELQAIRKAAVDEFIVKHHNPIVRQVKDIAYLDALDDIISGLDLLATVEDV